MSDRPNAAKAQTQRQIGIRLWHAQTYVTGVSYSWSTDHLQHMPALQEVCLQQTHVDP